MPRPWRRKFSSLAGGATLHELSAPEAERAHRDAQQAVAGAGADLPGRARTAHHRREPLRHADPEHRAGRRHELAAVPDHPRGAGHGLLHLLRPERKIKNTESGIIQELSKFGYHKLFDLDEKIKLVLPYIKEIECKDFSSKYGNLIGLLTAWLE